MKKTLYLVCTALLTLACNLSATKATAQDKMAPGPERQYGGAVDLKKAISTTDLVKAMATTDSLPATLECEIITSCVKKGCWMDVKLPDGEVMKVRFKDYGFFVPTKGLEGKRAVMQGYATKETTDVATLQHYAEDAGQSKEDIAKITEPKTSLMFLADGVVITF